MNKKRWVLLYKGFLEMPLFRYVYEIWYYISLLILFLFEYNKEPIQNLFSIYPEQRSNLNLVLAKTLGAATRQKFQ